ncbi:MAG TPA: YlxR family protein [Actinomycetota bacterium]
MTGLRREPERTCVGCRRRGSQRSLLRVVVGSDGMIRPDPAGREPGRGAYLHRDVGCIEAAVRRGTLARALRAAPDAGGAARLLEALRTAGAAVPGRTASTDTTARTTEGR